MYTHPVISQRSPGWFFFLVKLTFLHSASPAPISAIQNVHSDHRTSQEIDSLDAALPFFIFESQIFIIWHLPCFALILERKNALSLPSLGKTTKAKQHRLQWSGQGGCSKTSSSRLQIMQDRKMPLKQLLPPNSRNTSMHWITQKPGVWEEKKYQFRLRDTLRHLPHLEDLAPSKKAGDQILFFAYSGWCIPWSCLWHPWGMFVGGKF